MWGWPIKFTPPTILLRISKNVYTDSRGFHGRMDHGFCGWLVLEADVGVVQTGIVNVGITAFSMLRCALMRYRDVSVMRLKCTMCHCSLCYINLLH